MSKKIAIPSAQPGGLYAGLGMHFGPATSTPWSMLMTTMPSRP